MADLYWRTPWWLLLALYPVVLGVLKHRLHVVTLRRYADPQLHAWVTVTGTVRSTSRLQQAAMVLFWILLAVALAGPRTPLVISPQAQPPRGTLITIVDLSRSMDVNDMGRSRKDAAMQTLRAWVNSSHLPEMGLVIFAGDAHLYLPPTAEREILDRFVTQLPDIRLPTHGNQLAGAFEIAGQLLRHAPRPHAVAVMTDGDLGASGQAAAVVPMEALIASGVEINMLGFGGQKPSPVPSGTGGWLSNEDRPVLSALDDRWFTSVAERTGVRYFRATSEETLSLDRVWMHSPPRIADDKADQVQWREWFQLPLVAALLVLMGVLQKSSRHRLGGMAVMLLIATIGMNEPVNAATAVEEAYRAFNNGNYEAALIAYRDVPGSEGRFGEGVSCYRLKEYTCALEALADAAWRARTPEQRGRAAYNLGNVFFQLGNYQQAVTLYEDTLAHGVAVERAKHNLTFARDLAEAVQRQLAAEAALRARISTDSRTPTDAENKLAFDRRIAQRKDDPADSISADFTTSDDAEALIRRGVAFARAVDDSGEHVRTNRWIEQPDAPQAMSASRLWQRLFEVEAGFPVPLDRPRARKGVQPW